ncbi:MAG: hypothetical protein D6689_09355, partial [Deltaproteobacteria bacterium]
FPPVHTPTAFRPHAPPVDDAGVAAVQPPRPPRAGTPPLWLLAVAFAVSFGVGLAVTVGVAALL